MNEKIVRAASKFITNVGKIIIFIAVLSLIMGITYDTGDDWDGLSRIIYAALGILLLIVNTPFYCFGVNTLKYLKGERKSLKRSIIYGIISLIINSLLIYLFIIRDITRNLESFSTGEVYIGKKIILTVILFFIFIFPILVNLVQFLKAKYKNFSFKKIKYLAIPLLITIGIVLIININQYLNIQRNVIKITEDNKYLYSDFENELLKRNLKYELPEGKNELASPNQITALDYDYDDAYRFSDGPYTDTHMLKVDTDRKFPMFIYDSYTSLIKKHEETDKCYYIGPEDWFINWRIYYINGKIYAVIAEESEYGKGWDTKLDNTQYGIVVSEDEEITIYNRKKNYFAVGGGFLSIKSGQLRNNFPTVIDKYNDECIKIKVVDRVDAETLDKIAIELSPQYWKEFKK